MSSVGLFRLDGFFRLCTAHVFTFVKVDDKRGYIKNVCC